MNAPSGMQTSCLLDVYTPMRPSGGLWPVACVPWLSNMCALLNDIVALAQRTPRRHTAQASPRGEYYNDVTDIALLSLEYESDEVQVFAHLSLPIPGELLSCDSVTRIRSLGLTLAIA